jgi:folate-binding protein YgfZ
MMFGVIECDPQIAEIIRLEAGVPLYGVDITDENLPQEVNRNAQAISFTKGCYLGQETVARIDALGHVNKLLVGLKFAGETVPATGTELTAQGKAVGQVTSAVYSPRLKAPLALGYVRTGHHEVGDRVESSVGTAEVISLPVGERGASAP